MFLFSANGSGVLSNWQVVMELIAGMVFCMWAALTVPGKFLSILPHSDENRFLIAFASYMFEGYNIVASVEKYC